MLLQILVIYLPWANQIFNTTVLPLPELGLCFALASVIFFIVELEKYLARLGSVTFARYMPEIDRLLVFCEDADKELMQELQRILLQAERKHNWHHALFSTLTRFPEEKRVRYRALLGIGMDTVSYWSGITSASRRVE